MATILLPGLIKRLNKFTNISLSINVKVLKIRPTILFAFGTLVLICSAVKYNTYASMVTFLFFWCFHCVLSTFYVVSNLQMVTLFEMVKNKPYICPCYRVIHTHLYLIVMFSRFNTPQKYANLIFR